MDRSQRVRWVPEDAHRYRRNALPQRCTPRVRLASTSPGSNWLVLSMIRCCDHLVSRVASAPTWNSGVETRLTRCGAWGFRCSCQERTRILLVGHQAAERQFDTLKYARAAEVNRIAAGSSLGAAPEAWRRSVAKPPSREAKSATSRIGTSVGTRRVVGGDHHGGSTSATSAPPCGSFIGCPTPARRPVQIANSATTQSGLFAGQQHDALRIGLHAQRPEPRPGGVDGGEEPAEGRSGARPAPGRCGSPHRCAPAEQLGETARSPGGGGRPGRDLIGVAPSAMSPHPRRIAQRPSLARPTAVERFRSRGGAWSTGSKGVDHHGCKEPGQSTPGMAPVRVVSAGAVPASSRASRYAAPPSAICGSAPVPPEPWTEVATPASTGCASPAAPRCPAFPRPRRPPERGTA